MTNEEIKTTVRGSILKQAKNLTEGERDAVYGDCRRNLQNIANMWNGYLSNKLQDIRLLTLYNADAPSHSVVDCTLSASDVSNMLALMKIARVQTNKDHTDSYVDACAYIAMAGEVNNVSI
jgi:hypothetical protein